MTLETKMARTFACRRQEVVNEEAGIEGSRWSVPTGRGSTAD